MAWRRIVVAALLFLAPALACKAMAARGWVRWPRGAARGIGAALTMLGAFYDPEMVHRMNAQIHAERQEEDDDDEGGQRP